MKTLFAFTWLVSGGMVYAQTGGAGSAGVGASTAPGTVPNPTFSPQLNNPGTTVLSPNTGPNTTPMGPNTTPLGPTTTPGNLSQPGIPGTLTPNSTFNEPAGAPLPNLATNNLTPNLTPGITPNVNSVTPGPSFGTSNTFNTTPGTPTP